MTSEVQWLEKPLGAVTNNHDGKRRPVKESDRKPGAFPYYGASGIVDYVDGFLFDGSYLLVGEDGENLRTRQTPIAFMANGKFWVNNHAHVLTGNDEVLTDYLNYFLQVTDIQPYLTGAVMPKLTQANLNRIPVRYPEKRTQKSIIQMLGAFDRKMDLNYRINQTLEAMAQAVFKSWFVDFDPVKAKVAAIEQGQDPVRAAMRVISGKTDGELDQLPREHYDQFAATAALFPEKMQESEHGEIPVGWEIEALANVTSYLNRGISPKYLESGGVLVLNQKCIRDFRVDVTKGRRHDPLQRKIDGREIQLGDVLVNSTGVGTLGRVAQVLHLDEIAIVDSHVTVVRAGRDLSALYLGQYIKWKQPEIEAMGEGSTGQTELSRSKLADYLILKPQKSFLNEFDRLVRPITEEISSKERETARLAELRDTLLPKLLSGELPVVGSHDKASA